MSRMSLNPETKHAANGTLYIIGRFCARQGLRDAVELSYHGASRQDQLDYRLAELELKDHGHSISEYNDLFKDLVKQHLEDFKTEIAAALQAQGFWDSTPCLPIWARKSYWLAPTNDEATTFHLGKEDIYRLCLDHPIIAGRRQAQAADRNA